MVYKDILKIIPTMQSVSLLGSVAKTAKVKSNRRKKMALDTHVKKAGKILLGIPLIKSTANIMGV